MTVHFCLFYFILFQLPQLDPDLPASSQRFLRLSPDSRNWVWWRSAITHVFSNFLISLVAFGASKILSYLLATPVLCQWNLSERSHAIRLSFLIKAIVAFFFNNFLCCTQPSCSRVSLYRWHSTIRLFQMSCRPRLHQDTFTFPPETSWKK